MSINQLMCSHPQSVRGSVGTSLLHGPPLYEHHSGFSRWKAHLYLRLQRSSEFLHSVSFSHCSQGLQSQQVFSLQQRWDTVQLVQRSRVIHLEWIIISYPLLESCYEINLKRDLLRLSVSAFLWSSVPTVLSCQDLTSRRRLYWTFLHGGLFWSPGRCIAVSSHSPEDRAQM